MCKHDTDRAHRFPRSLFLLLLSRLHLLTCQLYPDDPRLLEAIEAELAR